MRFFNKCKKEENVSKSVVVIGAGISGLTAAALLSKSGFEVTLVEKNYQPGGSSGAFKREDNIFDIGSAMMFGFGEKGFNPHYFIFNEIEENITVIRHKAMYRLHFEGEIVTFWNDMNDFYNELSKLFPEDISGIKKFYKYIDDIYTNVIMKDPILVAPSEERREDLAKQLREDPLRQIRSLILLFRNAASVLKKFTKSERVINFFNKLTSTYSYTMLHETPAIMAVTMFVENHKSSSYYIHGSSQVYTGKLEKAIEKYGGKILYSRKAQSFKVTNGSISGVTLDDGTYLEGDYFIYSGTVRNLYSKLFIGDDVNEKLKKWAFSQELSASSIVMYSIVDREVFPEDTLPVEMLTRNPDKLDEFEVTLYLTTLDDPYLNKSGKHNVIAIGPSFLSWPEPSSKEYNDKNYRLEYESMKDREAVRLINFIDSHFPGFKNGIHFHEIATPTTIERYILKNKGSVAGPKQRMGQQLLKRQHAKTLWKNLFVCGESTVMGTGTPAVAISGISAADMVLRQEGMKEYRYYRQEKNYVNIVDKVESPYPSTDLQKSANLCQWCEDDRCRIKCPYKIDIRGIMRRLYVGNISGAKKLIKIDGKGLPVCVSCTEKPCEYVCKRLLFNSKPVPIHDVMIRLSTEENSG
jgi:prolycopene isomerase